MFSLRVSIPFKREGLSELHQKVLLTNSAKEIVSIPFKREGLSELETANESPVKSKIVSIPFKREGLSERKILIQRTRVISTTVSIPFKREGLSEPCGYRISLVPVYFVSIPFKREGLSERVML